MTLTWKSFWNGALVAGVVSSSFASGLSVYLTYRATQQIESTKAAIERVVRFESNTKDVVDAAREFIDSVNNNKDINPAKSKLNTVLATQALDSTLIKAPESSPLSLAVKEYQKSLYDFQRLTASVRSAVDMPKWIEAFNQVLLSKSEVSRTMQA